MAKQLVGFLIVIGAALPARAIDLQVSDPALQECLTQQAEQHDWTEVAEVREVECHGADIRSLEGIGRFTGVEKLSFYNNAIERVQLSGLPRLKHVNLAGNQLRKTELSDLPQLEELYLFRNRLERLHLSELPALKLLRANSNRMLSFEYDKLPALEKIYLFDNELETIDIHNLPAMQYMDVRENPMPDKLYEDMDAMTHITILHDGNADDW